MLCYFNERLVGFNAENSFDCFVFCLYFSAEGSERKSGEGCSPVQQESCLPRPRRNQTEKERKVCREEIKHHIIDAAR